MSTTTVTIVGNVVNDPTLRTVRDSQVVNFRVESNERYYDATTQTWRDGQTLFVNAALWGTRAEAVSRRLAKGAPIVVQGRLHTSHYESDGVTRYSTELRVSAIGPDWTRLRESAQDAFGDFPLATGPVELAAVA